MCWIRLCVTVLWFMSGCPCTGAANQRGRQFALTFPVTTGTASDDLVDLYVKGQAYGLVTVSLPGLSPMTHVLGTTATMISLNGAPLYTSYGSVSDSGVFVESDEDITVYVIRGSEEGYLVLPKTPWSTEYVVASYETSEGSYFAVTAFENDTQVEITFREDGWGNCENVFTQGVVLPVVLQAQQVWGLRCHQDLTGTLITSNKPISVVSGAVLQRDTTNWLLYFIEEMLLPVAFLGKNYVLPTMAGDGSVIRVIAAKDDTTVYDDGTTFTYLNAGDYYDIRSHDLYTMCIKSTEVVQLVLLGRDADFSSYSEDGILGDAVMVSLPPIESFKPSYDIELFSSNAIFFIEKAYVDQFDIDIPTDMSDDSFYEFSSCCNYAVFFMVDSTETIFTVTKNHSFGVIQLSTFSATGVAFIDGLTVDAPECPTSLGYEPYSDPDLDLCYRVDPTKMTWSEALDKCEAERGTLVKLDSTAKSLEFRSFFATIFTERYWIGLRRDTGTGGFKYTDGSDLEYDDWDTNEPNSSGDCVVLAKNSFLVIGWRDASCGFDFGYICEMAVVSTNGIPLFTNECGVPDPECPVAEGYEYLRSQLCIKPLSGQVSWVGANALCRASGDRLVTVDNFDKMYDLHQMYRHIWASFHIGASLHDIDGGTWVWTDCSPVLENWWHDNQPQDNSSCAVAHGDGPWFTAPCAARRWAVCQRDLTSNVSLDVTSPNDGTCQESFLLPDNPSSSLVIVTMSDETMVTISSTSMITLVPTETVADVSSVTLNSATLYSSSIAMVTMTDETMVTISSTSLITLVTTESVADVSSVTLNSATLHSSLTTESPWSPVLASSMTSHLELSYSIETAPISSHVTENTFTSYDSNLPESSFETGAITTMDLKSPHTDTSLSSSTLSTDLWTFMDTPSNLGFQSYDSAMLDTKFSVQMTASLFSLNSDTEVSVPNNATGWISATSVTSLDRTTSVLCQCACAPNNRLNDLDPPAVSSKQQEIRQSLLLNSKLLTNYLSKYISRKDDRKSAVGVCALGISLIVIMTSLIFGSDLLSLILKNQRKIPRGF